jgi:RNA polymerase sigma factor (sigma-70 family)
MAQTHPSAFLQHIRHLLGSDPAAESSDSQLLERFMACHDETAVEVLVRRYGPLVFGVCRRVLHNAHAAEDVFQATFLVLLRKASALGGYQPLGGWLYRVAYRLALRARANEAQRRKREAIAARNRLSCEGCSSTPSDLVVALEEELQKLPERHRAPLVLCYLEGKTNEQAAELLGCPQGSMSARLAQARERLRACLARRGYAVPVTGFAALVAGATAEAAVPLPLLANTVRAALWFAREEAAGSGFVSASAVALARGACRAMVVNKLKIGGALLFAAAMLGTGATMLLKASPPSEAEPQAAAAARPERAEGPGVPLPRGAIARMGAMQLRHGDAVYFSAYTLDGKGLVTGSSDRTVRLWDLATGTEIRRFDWKDVPQDRQPEPAEDETQSKLEQQALDALAWGTQAALSADGTMVAASRGGLVCVWQMATGKLLRTVQTGQKWLAQLEFSPDGKSLLSVGPGQAAAVWDLASGACLQRSRGQPARDRVMNWLDARRQGAVVSPGGRYLAWEHYVGPPNTPTHLRIHDLVSDKDVPPINTTMEATAMAFSADGKTLVWARFLGPILFSEAATGKELRRLDAPGDIVIGFGFSADGKKMAVGRENDVELWDLVSGQRTGRIACSDWAAPGMPWNRRPVLAFSPDGKRLIASRGLVTVRQFHADTGKEIPAPVAGHRAPISSLGLSADGKSVWTFGHGDPLRCWDWATGKEIAQRTLPDGATLAAFAERRFACVAGTDITLGDTGGKSWTMAGPGTPLEALALSTDGALLATRSLFSRAVPAGVRDTHLWDATTGKQRTPLGPANEPRTLTDEAMSETTGVASPDLVFSPDGRSLAGAGPSRQLCLWDAATGTVLWEQPPTVGQTIERFAFSANSRVLAQLHADGTVALCEAQSGARRARLGEPDLKRRQVYLTGSLKDRSDTNWRQDTPICLAFSPNGRYLAIAQVTPAIHLWDVLAGREVGKFQGHEGGVVSLLFTADGKHLISGGADTTALTWDLSRLIPPEPARAARLAPEALEALWTDLAGKDAARAFEAIRTLCAAPEQAVPQIKEHLQPITPADPKRLAQLVTDLQSERFELRRQAESELAGLGELAESALRKALADDPPLDLRKRLEGLLERPTGAALPAGLVRDLRAVEVLELIGTAEARQVLGALAAGVPTARLTREARSAMQRLSNQAVRP